MMGDMRRWGYERLGRGRRVLEAYWEGDFEAEKGGGVVDSVTRMCVRVGGGALIGNELTLLDGDGLRLGGCGGRREDVVFEGGGEETDGEGGMQMGMRED